MLRYHMAVVTRDNNLKREVKRVIAATASTADFIADVSGLNPERAPQLAIFDARQTAPDKLFFAKVPAEAKIVYIIEGDALVEKIPLLKDARVSSLFCHDARFDDDEFIATATKALRGEVFGLQKYFPWGVTLFSMKVKNHEEKGRAIDVLMQYANAAGCRGSVRDRIQLVADELMMNALYHAPTDAQGKELFAGKSVKELAQLAEVNPIQVQYGSSGRYFGISVRDGGGSLSREKLLDYLLRAKAGPQMEEKVGGAGLGLVSVLRSVSKLVFHLDKGTSTEVVALFDMELFAKGKMGARSLHVFEAPKKAAAEAEEAAKPTEAVRHGPQTRTWAVAAVLLAVASALGTAFYMQRSGSARAATDNGAATLTVYPDPADATVKLDGVVVKAGVAVSAPAGEATLTVERAGRLGRSIKIPSGEPGRDRVIHVVLP